jgi:hypothetical protein
MEQVQYAGYLEACIGFWNHPLQTFDYSPVWSEDRMHECY